MDDLGLDSGRYDLVTLHNGMVLQIHGERRCFSGHCCFHSPSDHRLKDAPLVWVRAINLMMRMCPHGHPHPDPDSMEYLRSRLSTFDGWHPCCPERCCEPLEDLR